MEWTVGDRTPFVIEKELSFSIISVQVMKLGNDYNIVVQGGDRPHVGCAVLAIPRLSLTGDGSMSATASVLNVTGHKDEMICRYLAEHIAMKKNAVVVCAGGFHEDGIRQEQIQEVLDAVKEIEKQILDEK